MSPDRCEPDAVNPTPVNPTPVTGEPAGREPRTAASSRVWAALVVVAVIGGLALRARVLASPLGRLDSDEAVVGLMGDWIGHFHKPPLFYWGQYYGGTIEPMLVAISMRVWRSTLSVKAVPLGLSVCVGIVTARAAKRLMSVHQARLAGALVIAWPGTVWLATKERGFYWVTLLLVALALLVALRLHDARTRRGTWPWRDAVLFGALAGLAWYESAQCAYVLLPLFAWLVVHDRPRWRAMAQVGVGGLLGAAPWFLGVEKYRGKVFRQPGGDADYLGRVGRALRELIPRVLGVRPSYYGGWLLAGAGLVVYLVLIAALGFAIVRGVMAAHGWRGVSVTIVIAVSFPLLVAIPRTASATFEPRYGLMLVPIAALLVARMATRPWIGAAIVAVALAFGAANVHALLDFSRVQPAALDLTPSRLGPLERVLFQQGITRVYADYWIANPLTFDHVHGIVASPIDLPRAVGPKQIVDSAHARDWVVYRGSNRARAIPARLALAGVHVTRRDIAEFTIYHLDRYFDPISLGHFWADHVAGRF